MVMPEVLAPWSILYSRSKSRFYEQNVDALVNRVTDDPEKQEHLIDLLIELSSAEAAYERDKRKREEAQKPKVRRR